MSEKPRKLMPQLRIRGCVYQIDNNDPEYSGFWTYFIRIGEDVLSPTFHIEQAFSNKQGALDDMTAKVKVILKEMENVDSDLMYQINNIDKGVKGLFE